MKIYLHVQVNKGQSHILPTVPLEGVLCNGPSISNEEVLYCNNNFKKLCGGASIEMMPKMT